MSLPVVVVTPPSELVTKADAGIVRRGFVGALTRGQSRAGGSAVCQQEAARQAVLRLRPHHAGVHVHVPGEAPIDHERNGVDRAGALRGARIGTTGIHASCEAVLPLMIICPLDVGWRG